MVRRHIAAAHEVTACHESTLLLGDASDRSRRGTSRGLSRALSFDIETDQTPAPPLPRRHGAPHPLFVHERIITARHLAALRRSDALISLRLPDELERLLAREAELEHKGRSEIAREAIAEYLARRERERFLAEIARAPLARGARDRLAQDCQVMPEQPRTLDRDRLRDGPLTRLEEGEMRAVEKSLMAVLGLL